MSAQQPDTRDGFYYVTVIDGPRVALAFGPFVNDHAAAQANPWTHFYAWGTCRCTDDRGPGVLGAPDAPPDAPRAKRTKRVSHYSKTGSPVQRH